MATFLLDREMKNARTRDLHQFNANNMEQRRAWVLHICAATRSKVIFLKSPYKNISDAQVHDAYT